METCLETSSQHSISYSHYIKVKYDAIRGDDIEEIRRERLILSLDESECPSNIFRKTLLGNIKVEKFSTTKFQ